MSSLKAVGLEFSCLNGMTRNLEEALNARLLTFLLSLCEKSFENSFESMCVMCFKPFFGAISGLNDPTLC